MFVSAEGNLSRFPGAAVFAGDDVADGDCFFGKGSADFFGLLNANVV